MRPRHETAAAKHDLDWRRSSRCSLGSCVEVAATPSAVFFRDSKQCDLEDQPVIRITPNTLWDLTSELASGRSEIDLDGLTISMCDDGSIVMSDSDETTSLYFENREWSSFTAALADGEFS